MTEKVPPEVRGAAAIAAKIGPATWTALENLKTQTQEQIEARDKTLAAADAFVHRYVTSCAGSDLYREAKRQLLKLVDAHSETYVARLMGADDADPDSYPR